MTEQIDIALKLEREAAKLDSLWESLDHHRNQFSALNELHELTRTQVELLDHHFRMTKILPEAILIADQEYSLTLKAFESESGFGLEDGL